jgi:asparagine synthase (glutamine-hydrolysing)
MTILAGIFSRTSGGTIPEPTRRALRQLISRDPRDSIHERGAADWFMAKVDIGAFDSPALCDNEDGAASMLCGEPLLGLGSEHTPKNRTTDLRVLHAAIKANDWSPFVKSTGTYCGAHIDPTSRKLTLFTDKVGLRPIYYWSSERFVIYASAMRILEAFADVPKRMNLRGVTEISCFGFPLADRTAYEDIKTLRAGEIVQFSDQAAESVEYWRWDRLEPQPLTGADLAH